MSKNNIVVTNTQSDWSVGGPLFHLETSQFTYRPLREVGLLLGCQGQRKMHSATVA